MLVSVDTYCHFSLLETAFKSRSICPSEQSIFKVVLSKLTHKASLFVRKGKLSISFSLVLNKSAFVDSTWILFKCRKTVQISIEPLTFRVALLVILVGSVPMRHQIVHFSLIFVAMQIFHLALALYHVIFPRTLQGGQSWGKSQKSFSMAHPILPQTLVNLLIWPSIGTLTIKIVVFKLSLIHVTRITHQLSLTFPFVFHKVTHITGFFKVECALSMSHAIQSFTLVRLLTPNK